MYYKHLDKAKNGYLKLFVVYKCYVYLEKFVFFHDTVDSDKLLITENSVQSKVYFMIALMVKISF